MLGRETEWRQGNLLTEDTAHALGLLEAPDSFSSVVVISHDCDLANDTEELVEVIVGSRVDEPNRMLTNARNPRRIHLTFADQGGEGQLEPTDKGTSCFWLERIDGSRTDFSYISCIKAKAKSLYQDYAEACRQTVAGDLIKAKKAHFDVYGDASGRVPCDLTGELLLPDEAHLDHAQPMTFEVMVQAFRAATGIEPSRDILSKSQDQQFATTFTDPDIAQRFRDYHHRVANLRIIKSGLNLRLGGSNRMKKPKNRVEIR